MFQSQKGIYVLERSLVARYIGADVEAFNGATVTSAQLIPSTNQVRFTLSNAPGYPAGCALVYDYYVQQWAVFTPLGAVDSAIWQGTFVYLQPGGQARQEAPGVYSDAGNPVSMRVLTAPIQLAGLQGFQSVREVLLVGTYQSPHTLQISLGYDWGPLVQQVSVVPTPAAVWGGDPFWGGSSPYGGASWLPYQWRVQCQAMKCQAVQVQIQDVETTAPGAGATWSGLTFLIGIRRGTWRMPASRTA